MDFAFGWFHTRTHILVHFQPAKLMRLCQWMSIDTMLGLSNVHKSCNLPSWQGFRLSSQLVKNRNGLLTLQSCWSASLIHAYHIAIMVILPFPMHQGGVIHLMSLKPPRWRWWLFVQCFVPDTLWFSHSFMKWPFGSGERSWIAALPHTATSTLHYCYILHSAGFCSIDQ